MQDAQAANGQSTRVREALKESEERFRLAFDHAPIGMAIAALDGRIVQVNESLCRILGYTQEQLTEMTVEELTHPDDVSVEREHKRRLIAGEAENYRLVKRCIHADGHVVWAEISVSSVYNGGDKPLYVIGQLQDITDRKETEEALQVLNRAVSDCISGIALADPEGVLTYVNRACLELWGFGDPGEVLGRHVTEMWFDKERATEALAELLERRSWVGELIARRKDGSPLDLELTASTVLDPEGRIVCLLGSFLDATARKKLEGQALLREKLDSLGVLAGGIAHDFNNLLTVILGNIEMAKSGLEADHPACTRLSDAEKATSRAVALTRQLLTFSRGGAPIVRTASLRHLLPETVAFALRGSNVRCEFTLAADLWPAKVDEGQIGQAIHNIVVNADQAMPDGGTIRVGAENTSVGAGESHPLERGDYVRITVEDRGDGIAPEHLPRVFDPYFTTREGATGLGLATAFSIVRRHGGRLTIESERGVGTVVRIHLPAARDRGLNGEQARKPEVGAGRRVLVMDDDEAVRTIAGQMLTSVGYEVEQAADGAEAVALYREGLRIQRPFAAVILDLTVPGGMGGADAIEALRAADPGVRAIVSSGYSDNPVMAEYSRHGFVGVVAKPYRREDLLAAVGRVVCM
jgi:PAS domain S-box-containing protein